MPTAKYSHSAAVLDGKIYVTGGYVGTGPEGKGLPTHSAALEAYDPVTNTWTTLASLSEYRASHASTVVNGKLYVFGGFSLVGNPSPTQNLPQTLALILALALTPTLTLTRRGNVAPQPQRRQPGPGGGLQPCFKQLGTLGGYALGHPLVHGSRALTMNLADFSVVCMSRAARASRAAVGCTARPSCCPCRQARVTDGCAPGARCALHPAPYPRF